MKKKIAGILVILLLVIAGTAAVTQSWKNSREQAEQEEREQEEKEERLAQEQARLEQQKKQDEQAKEEETDTEEQEAEDLSTEQEEGAEEEAAQVAGLEGEAMIRRPADASYGREGLEELKEELETMVAGFEGDWAVYVSDLTDGEYMDLNSHGVKAASLIKLYIMGAVMEQVEEGNLEENAQIDQLLQDMITVSDNESSNELVRRLSPDGTDHEAGMQVVNRFAQAYGYGDTSQGRDLRDYREVPAEGENYTSVRDCGLFLERIYHGDCVSAQASAKMLDLLKQQTRTWKIPAGVPEGVVTANKTGELSDTENDAAIVYSPGGDYVLCVTSTGLTDTSAAQQNIVSISSTVYQYMNGEQQEGSL